MQNRDIRRHYGARSVLRAASASHDGSRIRVQALRKAARRRQSSFESDFFGGGAGTAAAAAAPAADDEGHETLREPNRGLLDQQVKHKSDEDGAEQHAEVLLYA